jgi:tetratricopeptide (TPR) repeat protein
LQGRNEADTEGAARLHLTHGEIARGQGDFERAEKELREALEIWTGGESKPAPDKLARARTRLARVLAAGGKTEEATQELRTAIAEVGEALGPEHPRTASLRVVLGELMMDQGLLADAREELASARTTIVGSRGGAHPAAIRAAVLLARIDLREGKADAAFAGLDKARAEAEEASPPSPAIHNELGNVLRAQGKLDEAEAEHKSALEAWEKNLGEEHPKVAEALYGLGHIERSRGKNNEAQELLERARRIVEKAGVPPRVGHRVGFLLAQVMWELGEDPAKSRGLAEAARKSAAEDKGVPESFVSEVDAWLAEHPVEDGGKGSGVPAKAATPEPAEEKPAEEKPAEEKPEEKKPEEKKPAEAKPAEAKPAEAKPAEAKPAEAKPAEAKPAEAEPAGGDAP